MYVTAGYVMRKKSAKKVEQGKKLAAKAKAKKNTAK